ncbi:MAG: YraN family protein [Burkholderiales bacterium]
MNNRAKGSAGEAQAAEYLKRRGHTILARNYYVRGGEVDIIFDDNGSTVFCEVKTRSQSRYGTPAEAVGGRKIARICKAALDYASANKNVDEKYRFDIIEVNNGRINHIKNAFEFIEPWI